MITISRNEKITTLKVSMSIGYYITLEYPRSSEMDAVLLQGQLQSDLNRVIERIRQEAYNKGWKDKASHKTKQTYFSGSIQNTNCI